MASHHSGGRGEDAGGESIHDGGARPLDPDVDANSGGDHHAWRALISGRKLEEYKTHRSAALTAIAATPGAGGDEESDTLTRDLSQLLGADEHTTPRVDDGISAARFREHLASPECGWWSQLTPQWVQGMVFAASEVDFVIRPELPSPHKCLADEMTELRRRVDMSFSHPQPGEDERGAMMVALLLYNVNLGDARGDITIAKVFALLMGDKYRCHNEVLFYYEDGVWTRKSTVAYHTVQTILRYLSFAESCFMVLSKVNPTREFLPLFHEIRIIFQFFTVEELQSLHLRAPMRKREGGWCVSSSFVCQAVRSVYLGKLSVVVDKFAKWGQTEMTDSSRVGVTFKDCYVSWMGGDFYQGPWSPNNECYWSVPCSLSMSPDYIALQKLCRFLSTTFADAGEGLQLLMALLALVARGEVLPHVMVFIMGPGGEGKTLFALKRLKAVLGSGHAECPGSMLQREREFQQQGHKFMGAAWMAFDEMRPDSTVEEEVLKVFLSGDKLPLRKNHEAETYEARWHKTGKSWNGNCNDCPYIASAKENCFARRLRAICLHAKFVMRTSDLSVERRVFMADADLEVWLTSPIAGYLFWRFWLLPFMGRHSPQRCREIVMDPGPQVAQDTAWLMARMSRSPDHVKLYRHREAPAAQQGEHADAVDHSMLAEGDRSEKVTDIVAVDTFKILYKKAPLDLSVRMTIIETLAVPSNSGVRSQRPGTMQTKNAVFEASMLLTPHLWRKVSTNRNYRGQAVWKYQRRNFNLELWETVAAHIIERSLTVEQVFGSAADWAKSFSDIEDVESEHYAVADCFDAQVPDPQSTEVVVEELVDIASLRQYVAMGVDRRQEQAEQYLAAVTENGRPHPDGSLWVLPRTYFRRTIDGDVVGRLYGPHLSLQSITREGRAAACGGFAVDIDMVNAFVSILNTIFDGNLPTLRKYCTHVGLWREAIMTYYNITRDEAKVILLKAVMGNASPPDHPNGDVRGSLPFVETLASECRDAKTIVSTRCPSYQKHFKEQGRRDPDLTTMVYHLMNKEHEILTCMQQYFRQQGYTLVAPVFDGAIFTHKDANMLTDSQVEKVLQGFKTATGYELCKKAWPQHGAKRLKREQ